MINKTAKIMLALVAMVGGSTVSAANLYVVNASVLGDADVNQAISFMETL